MAALMTKILNGGGIDLKWKSYSRLSKLHMQNVKAAKTFLSEAPASAYTSMEY